MSNPDNLDPRRQDPVPAPPARQRNVFLSILMVIGGLVLLLPGICALIFGSMAGGGGGALMLIWLISMLISAGGVMMIMKAFR